MCSRAQGHTSCPARLTGGPDLQTLKPGTKNCAGCQKEWPQLWGLVELGPFSAGTAQASYGAPFSLKPSTLSSLELFNIDQHQKILVPQSVSTGVPIGAAKCPRAGRSPCSAVHALAPEASSWNVKLVTRHHKRRQPGNVRRDVLAAKSMRSAGSRPLMNMKPA